MLRIYPVCIAMVRELRPYAERIARFDRDLSRQLRRSSTAVPLKKPEIGRRFVGPEHFGGDQFEFVEGELLVVRRHP